MAVNKDCMEEFNVTYWRNELNKVRYDRDRSLMELSEQIGISIGTLIRFLDESKNYRYTFRISKKIIDFVESQVSESHK